MTAAPVPGQGVHDPARLAAVRATGLLDTPAEQAFDQWTQLAATLLRAPTAFVTLVDDERSFWKSATGTGLAPDDIAHRQNPVEASFCQYVIEAAAPLVVTDAPADARVCDNPSIEGMGVRAWAGWPVLAPGGEVLGTCCVVDTVPREWSEQDMSTLATVAQAVSSEIALRAAMDREQALSRRLATLVNAGDVLAGIADPTRVLELLAELAVPALTRWCAAWVPAADGTMLEAAVVGGVRPSAVRRMFPPLPVGGTSATAEAMRTGTPVLTDADQLDQHGGLDEIARAVGVRQVYAVPMHSAGTTLGVLTLVRAGGEAPFDDDDLILARQLADRAGVALALAHRFQVQRQAAELLQRSLLPKLPSIAGVTYEARYRPGTTGEHVGGDWYDIIEVGDGRLVLTIGDVMGRGLHAAAVMGQLRATARAYARAQIPPAQSLSLLDTFVTELDGPIVTAAVLSYDPATGELRLANAGHPTAIVRRADGTTAWLREPVDPPLGASGGGYVEVVHHADPGDVLCLYTDGLVEDRARDLDDGMALLADRLGATRSASDLAALADDLLEQVPLGDDDLALLLVRFGD